VAWSAFFLGRSQHVHNPDVAHSLLLEALEQFRVLGVAMGEVWCLINLGAEATTRGDHADADAKLQTALAIVERLSDDLMRGIVLAEMADCAFYEGDLGRARALYREATNTQREHDEGFNFINVLFHAAMVEIVVGDLETAEDYVDEALAISIRTDAPDDQIRAALLIKAVIQIDRGDARAARRLTAATGWDLHPPEYLMHLPRSTVVRALDALTPIFDRYEDEARAGRAAGLNGTARTLAAHPS
jgi:ATP/maltotriose-dependent transcriptional regulator MalT